MKDDTFLKSSMERLCRTTIAPALRRVLPLSWRKRLVIWWRRKGLQKHCFLSMELLRDFALMDPNGFHRFLWTHHLAYAESYKLSRFGDNNIEQSRLLLFDEIESHLRNRGISPERDVHSVLDFGCSLGYVLHYAENRFPSARCLHGIDIDRHAIEQGKAYLREIGSKAEITIGDAADLETILGEQRFDVVLCCGVLAYFNQVTAQSIIKTLLNHTNLVLGIICLAHPAFDNAELMNSDVRLSDHAFIHNIASLIQSAGGRLVSHQWMGNQVQDGISPPYIAIAEPNLID
jgi:SAM-dependent methyltransferase